MKKSKKLIWQIFPPFLLITLVSLLAVSWYASSSMRHFFLDQTAVDLNARAILLQNQVITQLLSLDHPSVDSVCKAMGRQSATRFTVILPSGRVVGDSRETPDLMDNHANRPEIAMALSGETGTSIRYSNTLLQSMMYVARPIKENDNILAVIRAAIPTTFIERELKSIQLKIGLGGLLIALLAAGISLLISRRITRPIVAMKKSAGHFAGGDFSQRLAAPDSEEMAGLAEALNRMASQLDSRINTIINQRNEFETVLSSMQEGVVAFDNRERIISMNQAAAVLFECDPVQCQDKNIQEIVRNLPLQQFIRHAISGRELEEDDIVLYQNGEKILNLKSSPLLDAGKDQIGTLVVINDVTQLRRLENMRKDFVANVSHEIKTPLTAIKGFVETLHQGNVDKPEEAERFLGIIQKHVDRLSSIIDDLLSLSRIEQEDERQAIQFESRPILEVFRSAVQICRSAAEEKSIDINLSCEEHLEACIDRTLLEQAVVNLLDNGIKYSDPESIINLNATRDDSGVIISVKDQGSGIASRHLPRLFERFYRVDKARSRRLGGTGLGLAIVKHIAQAHGGHVAVESSLGRGSTFSIHLPNS
ncbi:MAG: HAMP domain-containing protein [Deltaproteobacteria bacterium]|jgi:two-component system phosphate regulon sensor histidine kinase PhoR|nr:HAMP domain-containing protein [Deltaproteobacteria bacterium]MBW2479545.1 HAMP domain-containing protein [Deltaproteobacteria bacterium]